MVNSSPVPARVSASSHKLVSWKSIAAYFDCDERTAKRWELERGLPVHRAPGKKRSRVFAYPSELEVWLQTKSPERNPHFEASAKRQQADDGGTQSFPVESPETIRRELAPPPAAVPQDKLPLSRRWLLWATIAAFTLLAIAATQVLQSGRFTIRPGSRGVPTSASALRHIPPPDAEDLYLRGRYFWNLRTADGLTKALETYRQAIAKDPNYAEAYAGLAESYDLLPQFGGAKLADSLAIAEDDADRAIALDPNLAAAHRAKAFALFYWDWDIAGSETEFRHALALDPNSAQTHQWYASTLQCRSEGAEAIRQIDEAVRLDPTSPAIAADAALFHADFADFKAGMKALREIEQTQPTLASPVQFLKELDFDTGDFPAYIDDVRHFASITHAPDDFALAKAVAQGWHRAGRTGLLEARAEALKAAFDHGTESGFQLGQTLLLLGHRQEALFYFNASLARHGVQAVAIDDYPWARKLSSDPGYAALFAQIRERVHAADSGQSKQAQVAFELPL